MRLTILGTLARSVVAMTGCVHEKSFEVTGVVPASEIRADQKAMAKISPVVVRAPRRDMPADPDSLTPEMRSHSASTKESASTPAFPDVKASTPKAAKPAKPSVTAQTALVGRVASVNPTLHFVVINFPAGQMARLEQSLTLFRKGEKIGGVKVTGPQADDNIIADVVSGEAQVGDEVRE